MRLAGRQGFLQVWKTVKASLATACPFPSSILPKGPVIAFLGTLQELTFHLWFFFFLFIRGRKTKHFLQLEFFPLGQSQ